MSTLQIRPSTPADLPAWVDLQNTASSDHPTTLPLELHRESTRRPDMPFGRLVAEHQGKLVGAAQYFRPEWLTGSDQRIIGVTVHPDERRQGIGAALYTALLAELGKERPLKLTSGVREDRQDALHFAASRGYRQVAREQDVELTLAQLDLSQRERSFATAQVAGYELKTFADVAEQEGADAAWQKYYDLDCDASRDVPLPPGETIAKPTLERYRERLEHNPEFDPTLRFVASRAGELAALSELYKLPVPGRFETGFTGVARAHRGHRLAWALKYTALEEAIRRGATTVRTSNDETNAPMRNINTGLGFVPIPAYLIMSMTLD
jgi:GNAT superfamily N-acetyltransferase